MKNRFLFAILITFIILSLTACGKGAVDEKPGDLEEEIQGEDIAEKNEDSKPVVREDEDKLLEIVIEDGEATVSFNLDRWEEIFNISETAPAYLDLDAISEGPFPIIVEDGKVIDAYTGGIRVFPYGRDDYGLLMATVLLMDDGSLRWFEASPYWTMYINQEYGETGFNASDKLPHKDDYVSFSYEADGQGIGNKTVYAINKKGEKFDLYYLIMEGRLFYGTWSCTFPDANSGALTFMEDGGIKWEIGRGDKIYESWEGTYEYIKSNDRDYPIGSLLFDLDGWWSYEDDRDLDYEARIIASYGMDYQYMEDMILYHNDGTFLYQSDKDTRVYDFWYYMMEED